MRPDEIPRIAHDPATLEAFYRDHVEAVERFVARRVDDPRLVADLTAEVFLAAIDAAATYRPARGAPAAWLYGIARNVVSSERRRAGRERRANADLLGRRLLDDDDIARMQERIDAQASARDLYAALAGLSDGERAVFELTALDGLTPAEAASALGIRAVTARVRIHRARTSLRGRLSEETPPLTRPVEARP
ncbi:MAG TPA: sigma-70 family RNA polymerase sigma factor [Gaiellales bacterium]|jgi:RNA polymerase sigma-70 factor (ECF subfamily)